MNIEEMTKKYNLMCNKVVRDTIHELAEKWGPETVADLNNQGYDICVELYRGDICINAYIARDEFFGPCLYANHDINQQVADAFHKLDTQVVINAMLYQGMDTTAQIMTWGIN